jgi:hypothetical protein
MKTTKYLYDVEPKEFVNMKYIDALKFKHTKAKELHSRLHTLDKDNIYNPVLEQRLNDIWRAILHLENLIYELDDGTYINNSHLKFS